MPPFFMPKESKVRPQMLFSRLNSGPLASGSVLRADENARWRLVVLGLLLVGVLLLYLPGIYGGFLLDDEHNIAPAKTENLSWEALGYTLSNNVSGPTRRPVSVLSFAINQYFSGYLPGAFKWVNILIHLVNTSLVYLLLAHCFALMPSLSKGTDTRSTTISPVAWQIALLGAALWGFSPMHVSTVLYAVQRMTMLAAMFGTGSLLFYIRARTALEYGPSPRYWANLAGALICFVLAVLSKENGLVIIPLVLALELTVLKQSRPGLPWRVSNKVTTWMMVAGIAAAAALLTLAVQNAIPAYWGRNFTMAERLVTQVYVLAHYVLQLLVPYSHDLKFYYDDLKPIDLVSGKFLGALVFWGLVFTGMLLTRWKHVVPWRWGVLFFLAAQSMESSFWPLELAFEHRNYLPSVGVYGLVAYFAWRGYAYLEARRTSPDRGQSMDGRLPASVLMGVVIVFYAVQLHGHVALWSDDRLFNRMMALYSPGSPRAQLELAKDYLREGSLEKGNAAMSRLRALDPDELGVPLLQMQIACESGKLSAEQIKNTTVLAEKLWVGYLAVGALQSQLASVVNGKCSAMSKDELVQLMRAAMENKRNIRPLYTRLLYAYSLYLAEKWEAAASVFEDALTRKAPESASKVFAHYHLGILLVRKGDLEGARRQLDAIKDIQGNGSSSEEIISLTKLINDPSSH